MQRPPLEASSKASPTGNTTKRYQEWVTSHPRLSRYTKALRPRVIYEPLKSRQIRILELQPGHGTEPFRGRFIIASIDRKVKYDALSYMWGDPAPVDEIFVDGGAIPLASNLSTALRYIRNCKKPKPVRIWIDAICINQDDVREREQQVAMMRTVYSNAQTVRIWINEPNLVEDDPAVAALCEFRHSPEHVTSLRADNISFWKPVFPLFTNDYWNRLWIQQEAKTKDIYYSIVWPAGNPASSFLREYKSGNRYLSLVELLYSCRKAEAARPQDRLYAIMHLAYDYEQGAINVDYSKSLVQTMLEAASSHVNRIGDLGDYFLHISSWYEDLNADGRVLEQEIMPTWIPRVWFGINASTGGVVFRYHNRNRLRTRCIPNSVDTLTRRLTIRGVKVESVGRLLGHQLRLPGTTIGQFWSSDLGRFLDSHSHGDWKLLPRDVTKVLAAPSSEAFGHEDCVSALEHLSLLDRDMTLLHAMDTYPPSTITRKGFRYFTIDLRRNVAFLTREGYFGSAPLCGLKQGDEIWMILGCNTPIIVRPQPNGAYWHICTTYIPKIIEHEDIVQHLTSDVKPGDKVGQWTVQDIQLE
ncbi:heterokaryon incompatibility protein-domain-containing protein [Paraphoma chrysanthemicola]|uniref:Heterokaryon incompatibility protein-domain-containing protein n=1 Tax=Paraphoma chrysanthemicola TaxID=798071 RepID=A0A8K0R2E7_9PLEO|nr:heterokaryon incompatibility protein-domain-containing protein [Paraphoma chrysanthemicola]